MLAAAHGAAAPPAAPPPAAVDPVARFAQMQRDFALPRVADAVVDRIVALTSSPVAAADDFALALELGVVVTRIQPDDPDLWRLLLQLADIVGRDDLIHEAVDRIVQLDPTDEVIRLRRILLAIERRETAEARIEAFQAVLTPARIAQLGPAVSSRLAMDYALLLRRTGDLDGYSRWLAEAMALDPSNPFAASEVAGFYAAATEDPVAVAELLVARCAADPSNLLAVEQLGRFAMRRGAFASARRLFGIVAEVSGGARAVLPDLLNDFALATWGSGDAEAALRLIDIRQREEDGLLRERFSLINRRIEEGTADAESINEVLARMPGPAATRIREAIDARSAEPPVSPLWPELAATRCAILQVLGRPEAQAAARELVRVEALFNATARDNPRLTDRQRSDGAVEAAWWMLFLGEDLPAARAMLEGVDPETLDPSVRERLEGWIALRSGDAAAAEERFGRLEGDPRATLGRAILARRDGDRARAAALLLSCARELGGTIEGLWAQETLLADLGARAPISDAAAGIDSIIATLPSSFDRLLLDPGRQLTVAIRPQRSNENGIDRIEATVSIMNRSSLPLAVSPSGPIRSTIAVPMSSTNFGIQYAATRIPLPVLLDVGRRLRLMPRETMEVRVNLSRSPAQPGVSLGMLMRELALSGTTSSLDGRAILNPRPVAGSSDFHFVPGLLGTESAPMNVRVEGVPFETDWRVAAVEEVRVVDRVEDLATLATLAFRSALLDPARTAELPPTDREAIERAAAEQIGVVQAALPQLDPAAIAWITMQLRPRRPQLFEIETAIRGSAEPLVRLGALLSIVDSPADPLIDVLRRGDDRELARIAELVAGYLQRRLAGSR